MTCIELVSIVGSLSSSCAVLVSLGIYWCQRYNEKRNKESEIKREINGIKSLLLIDCIENNVDLKKMIEMCDFLIKGDFEKSRFHRRNNDFIFVSFDKNMKKNSFFIKNIKLEFISKCILPASKLNFHHLDLMRSIIIEHKNLNEMIDNYGRVINDNKNNKAELKRIGLNMRKHIQPALKTWSKLQEICNKSN